MKLHATEAVCRGVFARALVELTFAPHSTSRRTTLGLGKKLTVDSSKSCWSLSLFFRMQAMWSRLSPLVVRGSMRTTMAWTRRFTSVRPLASAPVRCPGNLLIRRSRYKNRCISSYPKTICPRIDRFLNRTDSNKKQVKLR